MSETKGARQRLGHMRRNLITSLVINALVPLVLYLVLRQLFADDLTPLVIAGAVPAVRTVALWVMRRRVDWIGAYAVLGFAVAIAFLALSGGNSLFLKIHDQLLTGTVGVVLLVSAIVNKPLLEPIVRIFSRTDLKQSGSPVSQKKITVVTALAGALLLVHAGAHVVLALTLPTTTFLVMSRVLTLAMVGGGVALVWWARQRAGGSAADDAKSN